MRDNLTTYRIWAPDQALWTQWAKPVLFASCVDSAGRNGAPLHIPEITWAAAASCNTMVVVDLPGKAGVEVGLGLARLGYRPVPLYNGVASPNYYTTTVKVEDIAAALAQGADVLERLRLRPDAPPAFLLDSNRMQGQAKQPGAYDNRWCVFPQDMPSAPYLLEQGISHVVLRAAGVQNDLAHILGRYQDAGIKIYQTTGKEQPREFPVLKPSQFRSLSYRFKTIAGLTRNAAGGFGGAIPEPTQSDTSVRYYGMG